MGRISLNRVGEKFVSKPSLGSCEFIIVEYNNSNDLVVQFLDKYGAKVCASYARCKKGSIKNPYYPSVFNKGCLGLLSDGSKPILIEDDGKDRKDFVTWYSVMRRCYSDYYKQRYSIRLDEKVCDRWLIYANFLEDLPLIEGYDLWLNNNDYILDIKGGSKVYSLDTCHFIQNKKFGNKKIRVYGVNVKTGKRTKNFNSILEAMKELGITNRGGIRLCINGKIKQCGGYKWYEVEEPTN